MQGNLKEASEAYRRALLVEPTLYEAHYNLAKVLEKDDNILKAKSHLMEAIKIAPKLSEDTVICVNSCGDALKDRDILRQRLGKYK